MDIEFGSFRVGQDGSLRVDGGLDRFPEHGIWSSDDRILAFCSQRSGGIDRLIFHGQQPQSANAFLLDRSAGALQLSLTVSRNDCQGIIPHRFGKVRVMPYGWENTFQDGEIEVESRLCAKGASLVWQVRCRSLDGTVLRVIPSLSLEPSARTLRVNGLRTWEEPEVVRGALLLTARDQLQTHTWINAPGFRDVWIDAATYLMICGAQPAGISDLWTIQLAAETAAPGEWSNFHSFVVCCGAEQPPLDALDYLRANPSRPFQEQSDRYELRARTAPTLHVDGYPFAAAAYRLAPMYAEAMKLRGPGALRSSAGGYYFVWGWDSLMGGHELTRWGDLDAARELLAFITAHRAEDGSVPHRYDNDLQPLQVTGYGFIDQLFISLLYQVYAETLDKDLLRLYFSVAKQIFHAIAAQTCENGFYRTLGMYPDAPEKLGRSSESLVAYENGFWYCACRMVEALAGLAGEPDLAETARDLSGRMERAYLTTFFDPHTGFLTDARVGSNDSFNQTWPRYSLFPLHNTFGGWLLRPVRQPLSRFIQRELVKTDGIRMVPEWDAHIGTETVTSACWFLHFDLYCLKALRRAGDQAGIERWLDLAGRYFQFRQAIPELQMMALPGEHVEDKATWQGVAGQIWQLFALSGWTRGLLEGVVGLQIDLGGMTFLPFGPAAAVRLGRFPFRGGLWDVNIEGTGSWPEEIRVDGKPVEGCCKIPLEAYTPGAHRIEIQRSPTPPQSPWILEIIGGGVNAPKVEDRALLFELVANQLVNVVFYSPEQPQVLVEGRPIVFEWDAASQTGVFTYLITGSTQVVIQISDILR